MLSPTNSGAGEAIANLEAHELQTLVDNGIVQQSVELEGQPINFDRAFRHDEDVEITVHVASSPISSNGIGEFSPGKIEYTVNAHDITDLAGNDLIKPIDELEAQPLNFERAIRPNNAARLSGGCLAVDESSPQSISAITGNNMSDDVDILDNSKK